VTRTAKLPTDVTNSARYTSGAVSLKAATSVSAGLDCGACAPPAATGSTAATNVNSVRIFIWRTPYQNDECFSSRGGRG
jgi:hypothetical protein